MFTAVMLFALATDTPDNTQSVLVEPTPAVASDTPAPTSAPTEEFICVNGRCRRVVRVENEQTSTQRRRLFGGYIIRNTDRTVYRTRR